MKAIKFFYLMLLIFLVASCTKDQFTDQDQLMNSPELLTGNSSPFNLICPQIRIAVVSDLHFMDPSIAPEDPENNLYWQEYVSHDRKIYEFGDPVFREVVMDLKDEKPDILLIAGDLAKDGEVVCHETVRGVLEELEGEGIKVFVVPGNNDIDNPDALSYKTVPPSPSPSCTTEEFASIYVDFGFGEALYRDAYSLSYICQPYDHLWILSIDAADRYATGKIRRINPLTMAWIQDKMIEANESNITVLAMMHYGILEHYTGQNNLEPLVKDFNDVATALNNAGIRLICTGHYHANDIVQSTDVGASLYDIQTGSLVTPPYSYRMMTLDDNFIHIDSRRIHSVSSGGIPGLDFEEYSTVIFTDRIKGFFEYYGPYIQGIYDIPPEQYPLAIPCLTTAYKAYFAGDEKLNPQEMEEIAMLGQSVPNALPLLKSLWKDLAPKDNKIHIKLK